MRSNLKKLTGTFLAALLVASVAVTLASCGGGGGDDSTTNDSASGAGGTSGSEAGGASGTDAVAAAKEAMTSLYAGESYANPPATSPKPKPNLKVTVVDFGLIVPAGVEFAEATEAAGKALGWDVQVYDGKLQPSLYQSGIRQAIASGSEAIVLYSVDCPTVEQALKEARQANITVVAAESTDCDSSSPPGPKLFDGEPVYPVGSGTWPAYTKKLGEVQADYVIAETDGKAKVVLLEEIDLQTTISIAEGFKTKIGECSECQIIETLKITGEEHGPKLQEKVQQALLKNPDANAVVTQFDEAVSSSVAPAIVQSGRVDDLLSVAGAGLESSLELVRKNQGQTGGYFDSLPWEAYATMDTVDRVVNGQEPVSSGMGIGFFDADHVPASGLIQPPIDYAAKYEAAWAAAR